MEKKESGVMALDILKGRRESKIIFRAISRLMKKKGNEDSKTLNFRVIDRNYSKDKVTLSIRWRVESLIVD